MQAEAPHPQPARAEGFYSNRWKKAEDAFHRITAVSNADNRQLLGALNKEEAIVAKSLPPLDLLAQRGGTPHDWEEAIRHYDHAMAEYMSLLAKAENVEPPAHVKREVYLAAIKTLVREMKAMKLEMQKDIARARALALQEGSNEKRRATLTAEMLRGRAAIKTAKSGLARLKLDKTHVFSVWNDDVKAIAISLSGYTGHIRGVLTAQHVQGIAVPNSITQHLDLWIRTGVPHKDEVYNHPDATQRVAALRELELTVRALEDWVKDTEVVIGRLYGH